MSAAFALGGAALGAAVMAILAAKESIRLFHVSNREARWEWEREIRPRL